MAQGFALGNILRVIPLDFNDTSNILDSNIDANGNFVDEDGFFIRAGTEGYLKYCPLNNKSDAEAITKNFAASDIFVDPEICRKIFANLDVVSPPLDQAENIYIGYGV